MASRVCLEILKIYFLLYTFILLYKIIYSPCSTYEAALAVRALGRKLTMLKKAFEGLTSRVMSRWSIQMITDKHEAFGWAGQTQLVIPDTRKHKGSLLNQI